MEIIGLLEKITIVIVLKVGKESIATVIIHIFIVIVTIPSLFFVLCVVCNTDSVCDSLVPTGQNGTCYRDGITVFENYQMCNVTSK